MSALSAVGGVMARQVSAGMYGLFGVSAFFLILAAFNLLFGPTCRANLFTAVSQEELPSLNRLRRTRKVLARITPSIEQVQGGRLDPGQYVEGTDSFRSDQPPPGRAGLLVSVFLATVLLLASAAGLDLIVDQAVLTFAIIVLTMGGIVLAVMSLIQAYQRRLRKGLLVSVWLATTFCGLVLLLLYGLAVYVQIRNLEDPSTSVIHTLRQLAAVSAQEHRWLAAMLAPIAGFGLLSSALGFFFLRPIAFLSREMPS